VLRAANVLDASDAWVGGDTVVVQLGDLIDRGAAMASAFDFVMALESKAAAAGGQFVSLLGNHEVMNLVGDLRYVAPASYAELADAGSEKRQAKAWREFEKWQEQRAIARGEVPPPSDGEEKKAWLAAHPPGLVEHREAFAPAGKYGRWLRSRRALLVEQGTLFVHGGVAPTRIGTSLDEIDRQVHQEIARFDELRARLVADGLLLPFLDLPEMTFALRAELAGLDRAEAEAKAAAELAGESYRRHRGRGARARCERFSAGGAGRSSLPTARLVPGHYWTDAEGRRAAEGVPTASSGSVGHTCSSRADPDPFRRCFYLIDTGMLASYFKGSGPR
jgi:hypothetical protein